MRLLGVVTAMLAVSGTALAEPSLDASARQAALAEVRSDVLKYYVFPGKRRQMADHLDAGIRDGRYDVDDPRRFAELVTEDLQSASGGDRHMELVYDPDAMAPAAPVGSTEPQAPKGPSERALRRNHGVAEMRILEGNVRYVRISNFILELDSSGRVVDEAMRFLNGGDGAIIDIRGNGGGTPYAVEYWISHFFDSPRELMTFHDTRAGETTHSYVLAHLPAGRYLGKPLAVLIDGSTGSAAESFAYHVKNFKLGTLVGRNTAGAGNTVDHLPVPPAFELIISTGRPEHPVTHTNWEGVGVKPDIDTPSARALDTAHAKLLQDLSAGASAPHLARSYRWALTDVSARLDPPSLTRRQLAEFAGQYGPRRITPGDGVLLYRRGVGDPVVMRPLGPDLFSFASDPDLHIEFRREAGRVTGMAMVYENGQRLNIDRTGR